MEPEQEKHLKEIKREFCDQVDSKYRHGQQEHGGDLFRKSPLDLVNEAINENLDQFVYLKSARDKMLQQRGNTYDELEQTIKFFQRIRQFYTAYREAFCRKEECDKCEQYVAFVKEIEDMWMNGGVSTALKD